MCTAFIHHGPNGEVVWRRLKQICLFPCQALSVSPHWTNGSPVGRLRPIDHWWRSWYKELNLNSRLIKRHIFSAGRERRISSTLTHFWNVVIQTLCALVLGERRGATVDPASRCLLVFNDNKVCTSWSSVVFFFSPLMFEVQASNQIKFTLFIRWEVHSQTEH